MPTVLLGRDQTMLLDGVALVGTREFEVAIDGREFDATAWNGSWSSTLVLSANAAIKVLIYWKDNFQPFFAKFNKHPPQPMQLSISNSVFGTFVPAQIRIVTPLVGVVAWEVTLKHWDYN